MQNIEGLHAMLSCESKQKKNGKLGQAALGVLFQATQEPRVASDNWDPKTTQFDVWESTFYFWGHKGFIIEDNLLLGFARLIYLLHHIQCCKNYQNLDLTQFCL